MQTVTLPELTRQLQQLPAEKLAVVSDFVSYLLERAVFRQKEPFSETWQTMLASEATLRRDWERPEEEQAWANL